MKKLRKFKKITTCQLPVTSYRTGFTLIETLTALAIFTVSVVALISITSQGISSSTYLKNKFISSLLAQEGIEMVRSVRDREITAGNTWSGIFAGLLNDCSPVSGVSAGCVLDAEGVAKGVASTPPIPCGVSIQFCPPLGYDNATGFYNYNSAPSFYTRLITINSLSPSEVEVVSQVVWPRGSMTFREYLTNWTQ